MTRSEGDLTGGARGRGGVFGGAVAAVGILLALCSGPACAAPARAQTQAQAPVQAPAPLNLESSAAPQAAPAPAIGSAAPAASAEAAPTAAPTLAPAAAAPTPQEARGEEARGDEAKPAPQAEAASSPASSASASTLPQDLTPKGMFLNAVMTVKLVMIGLAFASLATWTVWLAKTLELWSAKRAARRGLEILAQAPSLGAAEKDFAQARSPVALFVAAAALEAERSAGLPAEGVKERAAAILSRIEAQAGRTMTRGTGVLATIGSTAPFVGLFGTVWGIMDSFIGISQSHTTNLAVVAPGIAEALLATAMGLVAAIPAVVIYNAFARAIANYRALLGDGAAEVLRMLSRDVDRAALSGRDEAQVISLRQSAE